MKETMMDGDVRIEKDENGCVTAHVPEGKEVRVLEKDLEFWERKKDELQPEMYRGRRIIKLTKVPTNPHCPKDTKYSFRLFGVDRYLCGYDTKDENHPSFAQLNDEALGILQEFVHTPNTYQRGRDERDVRLVAGHSVLPIFMLDGKPFDPFTTTLHELKNAYRGDGKITKWG